MDFPDGRLNLFLTDIGEPAENCLRVVVSEGIAGEASAIELDGLDLGVGRPIAVSDDSRVFELCWDNYVAYAVRNESYWKPEPREPAFTSHLVRRVDSAFLAFVATTTFADDDYPGPLVHWALGTLRHCVDVVSVAPPRIELIKGG